MSFTIPHPERGAALTDSAGLWMPQALHDDELLNEVNTTANVQRQQMLMAELTYRGGEETVVMRLLGKE